MFQIQIPQANNNSIIFYHRTQKIRMLTSLQKLPEEPTPITPPIITRSKEVQAQLELHQYFNLLLKQETPKINQQKLILPKMRSKLLGWLQKVALETFHFSKYTLITASSIIDQYLEKTNESPSVLQLIGCTGLFLASKLREEIIVDPECYSTASCNVFSKKQLIEKQREMYSVIDWKRVKFGTVAKIRAACNCLNMKDQLDRCEEILWACIKDEELNCWRQIKLVYGVISLATMDSNHEIVLKDCLNLIRLL